MKWVALALILISVPLLTGWLKTNPKGAPYAWGLLTFLPFVITPWHLIVAPYPMAMWPGYVKGWEVSLLDAVAIGVIIGSRGSWPKPVLIVPFIMYIAAVTIAVSQSRFPTYGFAYVIQLCRAFLVFIAVMRVASEENGERALLTGLVLGLTVQSGYALVDRAHGAFQTGGSLGHQNLLGFVSHMALMPALGLLLSGRWPARALLGVVAGVIAVILTGSRATILLALLGLSSTMLISLALRFNGRKAAAVLGGVVLLAISAPFAASTLERRLERSGGLLEKDEERLAFERAAKLIISERPLGIGPNHYVFVSITEGFSDRAGVNWSYGNRSANVHQSYLLVEAETGLLGLSSLIVLLASSIWYAFSSAIRTRKSPESDVLVGLGVGLTAVVVHGFFEWMFVVYTTQYVFAGTLGLVAGLRSRLLTRAKSTHTRISCGDYPMGHDSQSDGSTAVIRV